MNTITTSIGILFVTFFCLQLNAQLTTEPKPTGACVTLAQSDDYDNVK